MLLLLLLLLRLVLLLPCLAQGIEQSLGALCVALRSGMLGQAGCGISEVADGPFESFLDGGERGGGVERR